MTDLNPIQPVSSREAFGALVSTVSQTYPRRTIALLMLGLVKALTEGAALLLLLPILAIFGIGDAAGSRIVTSVQETLAASGIPMSLGIGLSLVVLLGFISAGISLAQTTLTVGLVRAYVRDLQTTTFGRLIEADTFFLVQRKLGDSLGTLIKFAEQTGNGISVLFRAGTDIILALVLISLAAWQSASYVLLVVAIAAITAFPLTLHFQRMSRLVAAAHAQTLAMSAALTDHLKLSFTIKAFGAQKESRRHIAIEVDHASQLLKRLSVQVASAKSILEPTVMLLLCVTIWFGAEIFDVSTDRLLLLVLIFLRLAPRLTALLTYAQQSAGFANAYAQLLTIHKEAAAATATKGKITPDWPRLSAPITFDRVSVALDDEHLLDSVDLAIPPRGITAVIGASGAGKSTLIASLLGLIQPSAGRVMIEGFDLATLRGDAWRKQIGFVGQDTPLFHASLRENLLFAAPEADDTAMIATMAEAGLGPFLAALPQGLDTMVGEGGSRMSGGERQRFAVARALLRKPLLLVLDEPTSALDWQTAEQLLNTIEALGRTIPVLIVTHDLHLAEIAQLVYVLEAGRVTEQGSWAELNGGDGRLSALRRIRSAG